MSCGCKKDGPNVDINKLSDNTNKSNEIKPFSFSNIGKYSFKILGFLIIVALLPIINLFIIWFVFRTIVLNKKIDIRPALTFAGQKLKVNQDNEHDEDSDEDINPDDYEMIEVEELNVVENV